MKRLVILVTLLFAFTASAAQTKLFDKYESVRQALLKGSVSDVQRTAVDLSAAATAERQPAVAQRAGELSAVKTLKAARESFAALSEQMIRFRDTQTGERPVVVYCAMEKKSWLQPKGAVTNPYVDAAMRSCGEIRK